MSSAPGQISRSALVCSSSVDDLTSQLSDVSSQVEELDSRLSDGTLAGVSPIVSSETTTTVSAPASARFSAPSLRRCKVGEGLILGTALTPAGVAMDLATFSAEKFVDRRLVKVA